MAMPREEVLVTKHRYAAHVLCAVALAALPCKALAASGYATLAAEPTLISGKFGGSQTLSVYELPLTWAYHAPAWRLSVELPYLVLSGPGGVVTGSAAHGTRGGLGDTWLGGSLRLTTPDGLRPAIMPYARLKIPTASVAQGFGTGQPDVEYGSRFEWRLGAHVYPFAQAGYRINGRAAGLNIRDAAVFALGAAVAVGPYGYASLTFEERGALQTGSGPAEIAMADYTVPLSHRFGVQAFALRGFTPANAGYGAGLGITARF